MPGGVTGKRGPGLPVVMNGTLGGMVQGVDRVVGVRDGGSKVVGTWSALETMVTKGEEKDMINLHKRGLSLLCEEDIVEGIMGMDVGETFED